MDNLEKSINISNLFYTYRCLLTERQAEIMSSHYLYDMSLQEISDNLQISRQGVRDHIIKAVKLLEEYESKLQLNAKYKLIKERIESVKLLVDDVTKQKLDDILTII